MAVITAALEAIVSWTHTRSRIALEKKANPDADVTELRRQLRAERLAAYIEKVTAEAPPLTNEQREVLAAMLAPTGEVGGGRLAG